MFQVTAPHFCAAGELRRDAEGSPVVRIAAPIIRYMMGWNARRVKSYCDGKGWDVTRVP